MPAGGRSLAEQWTSRGAERQPAKAPPQVSSRAALYVLLGLGGVIVLACGGFGLAIYMLVSNTPEVHPEYREGLVNVFDVADWAEAEEPPNPAFENFTIGPDILGLREWSYEYDEPEGTPITYFVSSARTDAASASRARSEFRKTKTATLMGVRIGGGDIEVTDRSELLQWGDEAYLGQMEKEAGVVGQIVLVRRDQVVLLALFGGVWFEDEAAVQEWLVPVLERAVAYELPLQD